MKTSLDKLYNSFVAYEVQSNQSTQSIFALLLELLAVFGESCLA
jgi:hypothetical protein